MKMERMGDMAVFGAEGPIQIALSGDDPPAAAHDRAIFTPGASRWYALRVAPQREAQAEAWLKRRGVYAFHPVLRRKAVRFGKTYEYQKRYLPGYVFARFKGDPIIHRVCSGPFVLGALTYHGGAWGVLEPSQLQRLHSMRHLDGASGAGGDAERALKRRRGAVRVGEGALFAGGVFAGQICEVVELAADGGAKVRMGLLGGQVMVKARLDDLRALSKPC